MKLASRLVSTLGLLALVAGMMMLPEATPEGTTDYRWERLLLGVAAAVLCFLLAARLARKSSQ